MKKQQPKQKEDIHINYKNSRHRLIDQNRQLYFEIFKLQNKLSSLLTKNIAKQFKQKVQNEKPNSVKNQQTQNQIALIKQLKRKILLIKNAQKPQEKQDIRSALDQLTFLKKEKQKYIAQKEALLKKKNRRSQALQLNKPLQGELKNILTLYKSTQRQNNTLKAKSLKIQKDIINLHNIKQIAKNPQPKNTQNHQLDLKVTEHEISKLKKQIKEIQKEWQPRIESVNNEYFLLKEIKEQKQMQIQDLQKVMNTHKNRVLVMKQQSQILKDRVRLSQIVISPEKRQEINQIYKSQQEKRQFFKQFTQRPNVGLKKLSDSKQKRQQINQSKVSQSKLQKKQQNNGSSTLFKTQIIPQKTKSFQKVVEKQIVVFNQFQPLKSVSSQMLQKKQANSIKMVSSIAVGTTFYFNQDD